MNKQMSLHMIHSIFFLYCSELSLYSASSLLELLNFWVFYLTSWSFHIFVALVSWVIFSYFATVSAS